MSRIRESIDRVVRHLTDHPDEARATDSNARAVLGDDLRVTVDGPKGEHTTTDMPMGFGGRAEHPTPGWLFRAALASCIASTVGMEAARDAVTLTSLEVDVDSESDDRGILGMDSSVPAGPLSARIRIRGSADGVDGDRLREIIERGVSRSPVGDATERAVTVSLEIAVA